MSYKYKTQENNLVELQVKDEQFVYTFVYKNGGVVLFKKIKN